jgi:hypothetical protein
MAPGVSRLSDPGGAREIRSAAIGAAVAAVWLAAEIALLAALASAVRKAVTAASAGTYPVQRGGTPAQQQARQRRQRQAAATAAAQAARRLASLAAAIIATAIARTMAILIAAGISPRAHVPVPGDLAPLPSYPTISAMVNAAGRTAYADVRSLFRQVMAAVPDSGSLPVRLAAAQQALSRDAARGITGFTDASGRRRDLTAYLEMAVRTAVSSLTDAELYDRLTADGGDLILIWSAWAESACPKCVPWLGKVVSLTGHTPPGAAFSVLGAGGRAFSGTVAGTVQEAIAAGWRHPQCRCSATGVTDGADLSGLDGPRETNAQAARRREADRLAQAHAARQRHAARSAVLALTPHEKARARRHLAETRSR